ncbi:BRCT domain DNA repair protein [Quillaja saponaria]|uniref:BRCT domain DNA repair protein n=1 Tax=Quillaja saponaria TaxID=32244 RepID=A0AAD7QG22_QUISA|nr:BRCT domain DNA repair protein [Quillaja saponaria]
MGSLRIDDVGCTQTQPFDSQFSPPSSPGEKDNAGDNYELQHLHCTVPFDDNLQLDDVLETQEVNLAGETQVMNIAGETQVMNSNDETQILDDFYDDENRNTQLVDGFDEEVAIDSDGEGTDKTDVLGDIDELLNDHPISEGSAESVDREKIQCEPLCESGEKKYSEQTDAIIDEQPSSGPMPPRFTYARAEALRATALANRSKALEGAMTETFTVMTTSQSWEQLSLKCTKESCASDSEKVGDEVDHELDHGHTEQVKGFRDKQKNRFASSTVRKLFYADPPAENGGHHISNNISKGEDLLDLSAGDGELAGLSYVDSQEPGELSQANALHFVDRFLKDDTLEADREIDHGKIVQEKSKSLPSTKGQQSLAKINSNRSTGGGTGIFEWDDNREDEGGGDIFRRRKQDFFEGENHRQKFFPQLPKNKGGRRDKCIDDDGQLNVNSDLRLVLNNQELNIKMVQEAKMKSKRKLVTALDEQFEIDSSGQHMETNASEADGQEILNVGLDTQMAAEAMEALSSVVIDRDANNSNQAFKNNTEDHPTGNSKGISSSKQSSSRRRVCRSDIQAASRQSERTKKSGAKLCMSSSILSRKCNNDVRQLLVKEDPSITKSKKTKSSSKANLTSGGSENGYNVHSENIRQGKTEGALKRSRLEELNDFPNTAGVSGRRLVKKRHLQDGIGDFMPIAYRTRRSSIVNQLAKPKSTHISSREEKNSLAEAGSLEEKRNSSTGLLASSMMDNKSSELHPSHFGEVENTKTSQLEQLDPKLSIIVDDIMNQAFSCPTRRRSQRSTSIYDKGSDNLDGSSKLSIDPGKSGKSTAKNKRSQSDAKSTCSVMSSADKKLKGIISEQVLDKAGSGDAPIRCNVDEDDTQISDRKNIGSQFSAKNVEVIARSYESPRERYKSSGSASASPANCKTPVNDASPICMGNEYYKQSCKRNLSRPSLLNEIRSLSATRPQPATASKELRKRRDMSDVRVLYSHHLDADIIKHQKKLLARLGASIASSVTDATHFVADQFVRTRNMLEAIASGKPVVTHLWLESCGQASCFIDEKNYILRDAKKEKEFGFNMTVSLAHACRHPLLKDRRVLITPSTKPSKEILSSLVKAVQGQAVERIGRSALKDDRFPDDLLVLSCEEDYDTCIPFIEKGASVYSSELLLNGIVTQKLEFERHCIFVDHVRRTRSTIWLRKDGDSFLPVTKIR